jgi:tape measure domain-containing protein
VALKVGELYYDVTLDTSGLIAGQRAVNREVGTAAAAFNRITQAVKLYAAAMALVKAAQMADDMRLLSARVQVAAGSLELAATAMGGLQRIAARTQTELAANVTVFTRLNQSILQMGGNQQDTLRLTELLGMAIKVSGANAVESASAMQQFAQALGSGKLAGDEFKSLMENAPYLMRQVADGIGVPVGSLRDLAEQGKLTADVVTNALTKAADKIAADFERMPKTVAGALDVMGDAFKRLLTATDDQIGLTTTMAGVVEGATDVFEALAKQIGSAADEQDRLGKSNAVQTWAERTRNALSYVLDGMHLVKKNVSESAVADAVGKALDNIKNSRIVSGARNMLFGPGEISADTAGMPGAAMRTQWAWEKQAEQQRAAEDRGFVPRGSTLTPPKGTGDPKKGAKFDALAYLSDLREKTVDAYTQIGIVEQEALRKNAEMLAAGKINREQAETAVNLIEIDAANKRQEVLFREAEQRREFIERSGQDEVEQRQRLAADKKRAEDFAIGVRASDDPLAKLAIEQQQKADLLREYAEKWLISEQLYAEARIALEEETNRRIAEIVRRQRDEQAAQQAGQLQAYGNLFGSMADLVKGFAGKQNTAYKVLFAASKAFAIAESIIKIQQGIANAAALPFPANLGAIGSVVSATAGIISTIKGTNYGGGRQYGGPASAGSLYRVNETGRPEMFTAANGSQFMLPTQGGRVTAADQVGGGNKVEVRVHNYAGADVQVAPSADGRVIDIAVRRAKAEIAADIGNNTGDVWRSLRSASNLEPKL